jgi:hypothetical protein
MHLTPTATPLPAICISESAAPIPCTLQKPNPGSEASSLCFVVYLRSGISFSYLLGLATLSVRNSEARRVVGGFYLCAHRIAIRRSRN